MALMRLEDGWWIPTDVTEGKHPVHARQKGVYAVRKALAHLPDSRRHTVVQGGGHLGLWPKELALHFTTVITFEAHEPNYACLRRNVTEDNVEVRYGALGDELKTVSIRRTKTTGSHYVQQKPGQCPMVTVDSLDLRVDLDALFLDVEGYELAALKGASQTIHRTRPLIVCEENSCGARYGIPRGAIATWLARFGYRMVDRAKKDLIFAC